MRHALDDLVHGGPVDAAREQAADHDLGRQRAELVGGGQLLAVGPAVGPGVDDVAHRVGVAVHPGVVEGRQDQSALAPVEGALGEQQAVAGDPGHQQVLLAVAELGGTPDQHLPHQRRAVDDVEPQRADGDGDDVPVGPQLLEEPQPVAEQLSGVAEDGQAAGGDRRRGGSGWDGGAGHGRWSFLRGVHPRAVVTGTAGTAVAWARPSRTQTSASAGTS